MMTGSARNFRLTGRPRTSSVLALACLLIAFPEAIYSATYLNEFRPASISGIHGKVSVLSFSSETFELDAGLLAHHVPAAMKSYRFAEPVWIVGYKTSVTDAKGNPTKENYLCHTFFGDQRVMQSEDQELRGIYSDAFTPEVRLPNGVGIHFMAEESLHWMPMFNNRSDVPVRVKMQVELSVIRDKDLKGSMQPLYGILRSVAVPHLYFVPVGGDIRNASFEIPYSGRIRFIGTHIHPNGLYVDLFSDTKERPVWRGNRIMSADGRMTGMEIFSSPDGYLVEAGEKFRITAAYENRSGAPIDAMAGLFILYTRN